MSSFERSLTAILGDLIEVIYDGLIALPAVVGTQLCGRKARLYACACNGRNTRTRAERVIGGSKLGVLELGFDRIPSFDMFEEIVPVAEILQIEGERIQEHPMLEITVGILGKLLDVEDRGDVRREVGERLFILLSTVLDDSLIELAVGGDISVSEEVIPVGKPTLLGGGIGYQKIEMRDTILVAF